MCRPSQASCTPFLSPAASEYSGSPTEHVTQGSPSGEPGSWPLMGCMTQHATSLLGAEKEPQRNLGLRLCREATLHSWPCIRCPWHIAEVWSDLLLRVGTCSAELASLAAILASRRKWHLGYHGEDSRNIVQRDGGLTWVALLVPTNATRTPECLKAVGRLQLVLPRGRPTVTISPLAVPFFCPVGAKAGPSPQPGQTLGL